MVLALFVLASYGVVNIVTGGKIFEPLRKWVGGKSKTAETFLKCPMCLGFWVGAGWSLLGLSPVSFSNEWLRVFAAGCIASGTCWVIRVVMYRLGEDDL